MELRFSRRHPYEPPKVVFPPVQGRNLKNPRHPNVDTAGKLWLRDLSHDSWSPIMTVSQIVSMVSSLFSVDPPSLRLNRGKGRATGQFRRLLDGRDPYSGAPLPPCPPGPMPLPLAPAQ